MTSKQEQEFFEAMEFPKTYKSGYCNCQTSAFCPFSDDNIIEPDCEKCCYWEVEELETQITDTIVLRLIALLVENRRKYTVYYNDIQRIKIQVLDDCIQLKDDIREEVQEVFKC